MASALEFFKPYKYATHGAEFFKSLARRSSLAQKSNHNTISRHFYGGFLIHYNNKSIIY